MSEEKAMVIAENANIVLNGYAASANTIKCARSRFVPVNLLCKFTELM